MQTATGSCVGDLIVILEKTDEGRRRMASRVCTSRLLLPGIPLALVQQVPSRHRRKLTRRSTIVGEVRLTTSGERDECRVMPVFIPQAIHAWIRVAQTNVPRVLRFVLGRDKDAPRRHNLATVLGQFPNDVCW